MILPRRSLGLFVKLFVGIAALFAFWDFVVLPFLAQAFTPLPGMRESSNLRQLHLAMMNVVQDGISTSNPTLGWPGNTDASFAEWKNLLVERGYLTTNDLAKLLSAPGIIVKKETVLATNQTAVLLYAAGKNSSNDTVFLSTANFTNTPIGGVAPRKDAKPLGNRCFVVVRKDGTAHTLKAKQAGNTNLVGAYAPLRQ